jgi:hypothetical protein
LGEWVQLEFLVIGQEVVLMATRIMSLRRAENCASCNADISANTKAHWNAETKTVTCLECFGAIEAVENVLPTPVNSLVANQTESQPYLVDTPMPDSGVAGASALHEYERLHAKREANLDRKFGRFAGIVKFLTDDPQSTTAWAKGSVGERKLAASLEERLGDLAILLHDRKIPRSSGNIDHIVIAPTGVWIIDAKKYTGQVELRDVGGWFKVDKRVYVGGRDRTKLTDGLHKQELVVRKALGEENIPVHLVLGFVDAEWRWFAKPFKIDGVWVTWSNSLAEMIAAEGSATREDILRIANQIASALPWKVR